MPSLLINLQPNTLYDNIQEVATSPWQLVHTHCPTSPHHDRFSKMNPPFLALTDLINSEALRFIIAGTFNTALCYAAFVLLLLIDIASTPAMSIAAVTTALIGYFIMSRFVFRCDLSISRSIRFFAMQGVGYAINICLLNLILLAGISAYLGGIISLIITATVTFFASKYIVFHRKDSTKPG